MPTYPFKCECGHSEDIICKIADKDKYLKCPKCGADWKQIMCAPGMTIIHDCQGVADLYHKRVSFKDGKTTNTTQDPNGRYVFKNNPEQHPSFKRMLKAKEMENAKNNEPKS